MRNAFAAELTALAQTDPRIVLLSGDIGNRLFNEFKERFPARFFNCGVAEANMTSMAAGMALSGLRPITYTIAPFVTTRCLEQIRVDICYHHVPVTIVGVGAGLSYAGLGATHHSCEDIGFLRMLPGMTVICPGDSVETRLALHSAMKQDNPVYIRIGKKGEPVVHDEEPEFTIGKAISLRKGNDICLLSTGNMLPEAAQAADLLETKNCSIGLYSFHTVKPLDEELLTDVFDRYKIVVTIEEHSRLGGFGSAVSEWLTDYAPHKARLLRIGSFDEFMHQAGSQSFARKFYEINAEAIVDKTLSLYKETIC